MSSTNLSMDQIKLANLERLIAEQKTYNAEIAKKYPCSAQFISDVRNGKAKMGDDVVLSLAKALGCEPIEFYRIDFLIDKWDGLSSETVRVLMDAKFILEGGDEGVRGHFAQRVKEYKESLGREKERMELKAEVSDLKKRIERLELLLQGKRKTGEKAPG